MEHDPQHKPRNILPDCIIPLIALVFTLYYLTTITEVPWISQASAVIVSALLLLSILAFVIRSTWRIRHQQETLEIAGALHDLLGFMPISVKRIALLLLAIAYVWFIDSLGFTLTTFIFVFSAILLLSSRYNWKNALMVSLSSSIIGYMVFIYFFKTRFPEGLIENWLKGIS